VNGVERSIFKTCDIRGIYGHDLDEGTAYLLGRAVGSQSRGQRVVVGADLRPSSPIMARSLVNGVLRSGADVVDLGQVPTSLFYYAKQRLQAHGAVMVTASHNPARYNGFKVMIGDLPISPDELDALRVTMESGEFAEGLGNYSRADLVDEYQDSLLQAFDLQHLARQVVVDAGNGSLWQLAPALLEARGQRVERLFCTPDGTFPNRDPNPAQATNLLDLRQRILATDAELGIAYDGDGDRVIFVDGRGRVQPADRTLVLFVRHLLPGAPGAGVVYDLKSSSIVAEEVEAAGGVPLMERSGYSFIKRRLLAEEALLAGELSGHYFFQALGGDDALYATLLLFQVLDKLGATFAEAIDTVPAYPITPDIRIPCSAERAKRLLDELQAAFAEYPVNTRDGVRIQFTDGWALVRQSVTEPLVTLRYEAHSREALEEIQHLVRESSPTLHALLVSIGQ
jgi:phosphomannomutase/phosphoglucomutase